MTDNEQQSQEPPRITGTETTGTSALVMAGAFQCPVLSPSTGSGPRAVSEVLQVWSTDPWGSLAPFWQGLWSKGIFTVILRLICLFHRFRW